MQRTSFKWITALMIGLASCGGVENSMVVETQPDKRLNELAEVDLQLLCSELGARAFEPLPEDDWKELYCLAAANTGVWSAEDPNAACAEARTRCRAEELPESASRSRLDDCIELEKDYVEDCEAKLIDIQSCVDELISALKVRARDPDCLSSVDDFSQDLSPQCTILLEHGDCGHLLEEIFYPWT